MEQRERLTQAYKGKKVFITGHTGFKGSWLCLLLNKLGAQVKGYALAPESEKSMFEQVNVAAGCESVFGDIRDKKKLATELLEFQPDFIFHLAAQPLVRASYQDPLYTYESNVMGTAYLLEAVRSLPNPCQVVVVTTDKVYENQEWAYAYRESDALGGYDPYSSSKACAEIVTASYRNSFFSPAKYAEHKKSVATARGGNVIGGGDWSKDRIIPDIIQALHKDETVVLRNPKAVRPWQHVLDALSGYLFLGAAMQASPMKFAQAWNFGPIVMEFVTVEQLTKQAIHFLGKGDYQVNSFDNQPHETQMLRLDSSMALQMLRWRPVYSAEKAIDQTMSWYAKTEMQGLEPAVVTLDQIDTYLCKANEDMAQTKHFL